MLDTIFREYDIRGKIGSELPLNGVYDLGRAIAYYLVTTNNKVKTIAVGADGRTHSQEFKDKLCTALQDSGLDVVFIGMCPTPVLYFALFNLPVDAGLMITASHNGPEYNGIKICLGKESVWGEQIQEIKRLLHKKVALSPATKGIYREQMIIHPYVDWLVEAFPHLIDMKLSVIVDCGNGAGGTVLPLLCQKMKWQKVDLLYPEVDGNYPNHEADPTVEANMRDVKKLLVAGTYSLGLGLDGDCDRMVPMTAHGVLVSGDKLLALFTQEILKKHPHAAIVFDVKCSAGLIELLETWHAKPCMSPSGHSIIKNQMKEHNALLAGELSCHFFFKDRYFGYDDGIYAMMRLFELLVSSGKTLDKLLQVFPHKISTPEIRIECADDKKKNIVEAITNSFKKKSDVKVLTIDGIRVIMPYGWGILRASNTQPVLCLRFESDSHEGLKRVEHDFIDELRPYYNEQFLKKYVTC